MAVVDNAARTRPAILARNECVNTSFAATRNQLRTQEKAKYSYEKGEQQNFKYESLA